MSFNPSSNIYGEEEWKKAESKGLDVAGSTGPRIENGTIQSGLNQIAVGSTVRALLGEVEGSTMGPVTGMDYTDEEDLGAFTQNASKYVDVSAAVQNATKAVESLGIEQINYSLASSEKMFSKILNRSFSPEENLDQVRDAASILGALDRPGTSELSFLIARETQGRIRVKDIVRAVNDGSLGAVSPRSKAFQSRMGANSKPRL